MKVALDAFELTPYLMAQPLGYRVPDGGSFGWVEIPEFPFSVEPRQITRWEATGCQTEAALGGLRSLSFLSAWNPGRSRAGKLESGLARLLSLVCVTSEAVVDLNHTTSGPWLRSWQI